MGGKGKLEVFTGLSVGVAWRVYDALFVCYLPLCHISIEKKKRKKVDLVLEIDVDVKSGPNRQCIGS